MPKPRISAEIRLRIVQLRAIDPKRWTIEEIQTQLGREFGESREPSVGFISKVVKEWEAKDARVRIRDRPFQWHQLELAEVPWEAGAVVLRCQRAFLEADLRIARDFLKAAESQRGGKAAGPSELAARTQFFNGELFTNRWAKWCWRVSLTGAHLSTAEILAVADGYARAEQRMDLLPESPPMDVAGLDGWLVFARERSQGKAQPGAREQDFYELAQDLGLVAPPPSLDEATRQWNEHVQGVPERFLGDYLRGLAMAMRRGYLFSGQPLPDKIHVEVKRHEED